MFSDAAIGKRFVDRLYKVRLRDGSHLWLLLHIEVQASRETGFPKRVFRYFYRLDDKFDLPLTCLVVFADESPTWRPSKFKYDFAGTNVIFSYPTVKLADYRNRMEELERMENPFALIVLAHLQSQSATEMQNRLEWKRRITHNLLERSLDEATRWKVLRLVDWMIDLPVQLNEVFWGEVNEWKARNVMPFVTGLEQMAINEGMKKDLRTGLLSGLEVALEMKFNDDGKQFFEELKSVSDTACLRSLLEAIRSAATIDELRKVL